MAGGRRSEVAEGEVYRVGPFGLSLVFMRYVTVSCSNARSEQLERGTAESLRRATLSFDSASIVLGRSPPTITMPGTDNFNGTLGANGGFVTSGPMGGEMKILYILREKLGALDPLLPGFLRASTSPALVI